MLDLFMDFSSIPLIYLSLFEPSNTVILNYYNFIRFSIWEDKTHKI